MSMLVGENAFQTMDSQILVAMKRLMPELRTLTLVRENAFQTMDSQILVAMKRLMPELRTLTLVGENAFQTMDSQIPEVMIGVVPSSIRVPQLEDKITRIQYKVSEESDDMIPYSGTQEQTKIRRVTAIHSSSSTIVLLD